MVTTLAASSVLLALLEVPAAWVEPDRAMPTPYGSPDGRPHGRWWSAVAVHLGEAVAYGDLTQRADVLAWLAALALAVTTAWTAHRVFRGPGRWLASVVAGPIVIAGVAVWLRTVPAPFGFAELFASTLAMFAIGQAIGRLVRPGAITPATTAVLLASASASALLVPRFGLLVFITVALMVASRGKTHGESGAKPWLTAAAVGLAPVGLGLGGLLVAGHSIGLGLDLSSLHLDWPGPTTFTRGLSPLAVYPALAAIALMVWPLRWRGAIALLGLLLVGTTVRDRDGALLGASMLIALLSFGVTGWIWLAGSLGAGLVARRRRAFGYGMAGSAAALTIASALGPALAQVPVVASPVADLRGRPSSFVIYGKGLIAPGDILLAHADWLNEAVVQHRHLEGWRPDVVIEDARELDDPELLATTMRWSEAGRRVLSDSFDAAGRWSPSWVLDSGPLFWFVGEIPNDEREFTDLSAYDGDSVWATEQELQRWAILAIERARFRRSVGEPVQALDALPMDPQRRRGLQTRLELSRSVRPHPSEDTELPPGVEVVLESPHGAMVAEAGDLLFANGERRRAAELLAEAAEAGYRPALAALARWQIRAGEDSSAHQTFEALAAAPELHDQALQTVRWLLARGRLADAELLLDLMGPDPSDPAEDIATRLQVLDASAPSSGPLQVAAPPDAVSRR